MAALGIWAAMAAGERRLDKAQATRIRGGDYASCRARRTSIFEGDSVGSLSRRLSNGGGGGSYDSAREAKWSTTLPPRDKRCDAFSATATATSRILRKDRARTTDCREALYMY